MPETGPGARMVWTREMRGREREGREEVEAVEEVRERGREPAEMEVETEGGGEGLG